MDLVYYHAKCHDGLMAAASHALFHNATTATIYVEATYGHTDYSEVSNPRVKRVIFLDFCPPFDVAPWNDIGNLDKQVIIIDHHVNAINRSKEFFKGDHPDNLTMIMDTKWCGAVLTYIYFKTSTANLIEAHTVSIDEDQYYVNLNLDAWRLASLITTIPKSLYLTNDYDLWIRKFETSSHFVNGLKLQEGTAGLMPRSLANIISDDHYVNSIIDVGITLHRKQLVDTHLYSERALVANRIALVNAPDDLASELGDRLNTDLDIDFSISYMYYSKSRCYKVSLRSKSDSVLAIAEALGGGGHVKAAGVRIELDNLTAIQQELVHWITGKHNGDRFYRCLYDLNLAPIQYLR